MIKSTENQVLALAGVLESAALVDELANQGRCDPGRQRVLLDSIFSLESDTLEAVYGGRAALTPGLRVLLDQYTNYNMTNVNIARYQMALIQLQRRLLRDAAMQQRLRAGIGQIENLRELQSDRLSQTIIGRLAGLYQETISQLTPRVIVKGKPVYLQSSERSECIRALLLAGIRSAVLWQQAGGSRWSLLFGRRAYLESTHALLKGMGQAPD